MKVTRIFLFVLIVLALAACSSAPGGRIATFTPCPTSVTSSAAACAMPTRTPPALPAGALFQVLVPVGNPAAFTAADLKALPLAKITVDGKSEEGPRLLDVLNAAGVKDFSELTFNGAVTLTLKKTQLDEQSILVIENSARLAAPGLPAEQQVAGILTIRVK